MIEYKATDLPGKIAYEKPFNVKIRCITPVEQKYILSLSQKEQQHLDSINQILIFSLNKQLFYHILQF